MTSIENFFFELLQVAIGCRSKLSAVPTKEEWVTLLEVSVKQSLAGITFAGVERLPKEQWPEKEIVFQWMAITAQIEQQNVKTTEVCLQLVKRVEADGFKTCILKGQSNYAYYSKELKNKRSCGDIDIWALPKLRGESLKFNDGLKKTILYVRKINPEGEALYHHIDYGMYNGTEVEVHFLPSFMFNPIHNHRLQKWFNKMADGGWQMAELPDERGCIPVPSVEFNIIFQLSHIYNHVLHEGIGLRQMVDYYYVLKKFRDESLELKDSAKSIELENTLKSLGLWRFAGAVMYVMREVFALESQCMIAPVDEKRGKIILSEIFKGGNFGKYDADNIKANNRLRKNIQRIKRDFRMMRYFPSECLWEPVFRVYHFFWRMRYN